MRLFRQFLVFLDSNHTHAQVLEELRRYFRLVTAESYIVVFDTVVDDLPKLFSPKRSWGPGDNPKTAVQAFLTENARFQINRKLERRLGSAMAPSGYLDCVNA